MITVEPPTPSPELPTHKPSLADLSRNASVISSSSSSSSTTSLVLPVRPRPIRTFSSPRSRSPGGPPTPKASRPPAYITRELGIADQPTDSLNGRSRANSKSKSRSSSVNGRLSADDFEFGDILGEGSYSTVIHGTHRATRQEYAIKVLDKGHLKRNNKLHTALAEKNTLVRLGSGHPGIVRLHWAFQDDWSLYFVLDLARNGELQSRISRMGSLSTACARYYTAQLVDALDYMHLRGVIHRDLKPENLLLDDDFRIKVTDFGTGKLIDVPPERATKTFVGTAQYVSPELLEANETSKSSDLWALGCVLYQMIAGRFAFQGLSEYLTWQKIKQLDYTFPEGFDPEAADLVRRLLVRDPLERLGAGLAGSDYSMDELRAHPFFVSIRWDTLWDDEAPPLETGLVRREPAPADEWDDVGATWDELVGPDGSDDEDDEDGSSDGPHAHAHGHVRIRAPGDDGIEWAPDAQAYVSPPAIPPEEIGPHGEMPDYAREAHPLLGAVDGVGAAMATDDDVEDARGDSDGAGTDGTVSGTYGIHFALPGIDRVSKNTGPGTGAVAVAGAAATGEATGSGVRPGPGHGPGPGPGTEKDEEPASPVSSSTETGDGEGGTTPGEVPPRTSAPLRVPRAVRDSYATSSSDGSPVEKLSAALEAMGIHRGRLRTRSPTPARGTPPPTSVESPDWASALSAGETILFHAPVGETALKRRTSRLLLPLPVSQRKPKVRELALTSHRLVCLKPLKSGRGIGIKAEFTLREAQPPPSTGREKRTKSDEARGMITGVERKGAKEFVVLTTAKSAFFVVDSETAADAWVRRIAEALQQHATQSRERKPSTSNNSNNNNNCSPWISSSFSFAPRPPIFVPVNVSTPTTTTHDRTRTRTRTPSAPSTPRLPAETEPTIPSPPFLSSISPFFFSTIPRRIRQASKGVNSVHD
ncbi:kinase-like protein [Lactarius deliciosus]|nr:kinase-like protein [Lactarius deliciosus]